jgi:hypothetical protein
MSRMNLLGRFKQRRQRKAHERYLAERARQRMLSGEDAQQAIKDLSQDSAAQTRLGLSK